MPVEIVSNNGSFKTTAILDTGSGFCMFERGAAETWESRSSPEFRSN